MPSIVPWPSPLFGYPDGTHGRNGQTIKGICYHTMDGYWSYYTRIIKGEFSSPRNSANYSLNRDGTIHQHVPDSDAAWCNGPMDRPDMGVPWIAECFNKHVNPNLVTISIECEGRSGEPWTPQQVASLIWWTQEMMRRHPQIAPDRLHLVGHHQIYYPKSCPGPSFPWVRLMEGLKVPTPVSTIPQAVTDYAKAHNLGTVRTGPGLSYTDEVQDGVYKTTSGAWICVRHFDPPGDATVQIEHVDWRPDVPTVVERIVYPDASAVKAIVGRLRANADELESLPGVQ